MKTSILMIGGGNMGSALALRWRKKFPGTAITVIEPNAAKRKSLAVHGIKTYANLASFTGTPAIVVLAIKPQMADGVIAGLRKRRGISSATVISIMAGVPLSRLRVGKYAVRVMPNTPAMIGEGMSAICAPKLPAAQQKLVKDLFGAVGAVVIVDNEKQMHAVTAVSGSGPAYLFAFMESFMKASESLGLGEELSRTLVTQTVRGAALLADAKSGNVSELRKQVTSPRGTTEAALKTLKKAGMNRMLKSTVKAAKKRSKQLSK